MGSAKIMVNAQSQATPRAGFIYDVLTRGFDTSFWKELATTLSLASNKIRMASGGSITSYTQFKFGKFEIALNVPTTPSTGEAKKWGLLIPGSVAKGSMYFEIAGAVFTAVSYDDDGTAQTTTLTWSSYENTESLFQIEWEDDYVIFLIDGVHVATHKTRVGKNPLPLYLLNGDADNVDLGYISIKETAQYV